MNFLKISPTGPRALIAWNGKGMWPKGLCIAARANELPMSKNLWWWLDNIIYWTFKRSWLNGFNYMKAVIKRETNATI